MSMVATKLQNFGFMSMKLIGEASSNISPAIYVFRILNISAILFSSCFIYLNFLYVTGEGYVEQLESSMHISHIFLKYLLLLYYKHDIHQLLKNVEERFWSYQNFSLGIQKAYERTFKIMNNLQVITTLVCVSIIYLYLLRSVFDWKYVFLLNTFETNIIALDAVILFCQIYISYNVIAIIFSFDLTYLFLCVHMVLQLRLFKIKIQKVAENTSSTVLKEINSCIEHHQFLLIMFARMKGIFSEAYLFHYFITLISSCSGLFLLISRVDVTVIAIKLLSLMFLFGQFAYYVFPADEVACQFSEIAGSMYMSMWYKTDIRIRKSLLFMMLKCHRTQYFSGAGLMDINADVFGSVVRKTFSFYAIMRNILK